MKIQCLIKLNKFEVKYEYNIKEFCIKKNASKKNFIKKKLKNLLNSENQILASCKKNYKDSYTKKFLLDYKPFKGKNINFKTAVLHQKPSSKITPDYVVEKMINQDWLIYDYEEFELISILTPL